MDPFMPSTRLSEDVNRRLNNSILYYEDKPVYVRYISGTTVALYSLGTWHGSGSPQLALVDYTNPKLTDRTPTLGYVNYQGVGAHFMIRTALRDQRNGIPIEALGIAHGSTYLSTADFTGYDFEKMLLNRYPSITEAHHELVKIFGKNTRVKWAFSKNYALDARLNVFYQDRLIAQLVKTEYSSTYEVEFVPSIVKVSFYRRNLCDRFANQIKEFKPS